MKDLFIFFAIVSTGLLLWFAFHRAPAPRFRRKSLLTGSEAEFYALLRRALPECTVTPNLALSSLIEPLGSIAARRHGLRRIEGQRVGYAVFDDELQLLAVIELGRRSRPGRRELERERFLAGAGIRSIRYHAKQLPSEAKVRSAVYKAQRRRPGPGSEAVEFHPLVSAWQDTLNVNN